MLGLYFHWSYCLSKCIYCDFGTQVLSKHDNLFQIQNRYCECCIRQMDYFAEKIKKKPLTTIYFGGGTPSILEPSIIKTLINEAKNIFGLSTNCEITLEANPTTFEVKKFENFRKTGINRLSLGVQSLNDNNLSWLGRKHNVQQAIFAIQEIKKIFPKWSFDLIYGLPRQNLNNWLKELKQALELEPKHLSLYTLIVDENTILGDMVKRKIVFPKTEDELGEYYEATNNFISNNSDLKRYEISNYTVYGHESVHNINYWKSYDYIGIGAGAHGRLTYKDGCRYELCNVFDPKKWEENLINQNKNGLCIEKKIPIIEQVEEILLMGLRTKEGIDIEDIKKRFKIDLTKVLNKKNLEWLKKNKKILHNKGKLVVPEKELIVLDSILRFLL